LLGGGTNRAYVAGRLARDGHEQLAAAVIAGTLSVRRAARLADWGWREAGPSHDRRPAIDPRALIG
jgi:hypothetical protein